MLISQAKVLLVETNCHHRNYSDEPDANFGREQGLGKTNRDRNQENRKPCQNEGYSVLTENEEPTSSGCVIQIDSKKGTTGLCA